MMHKLDLKILRLLRYGKGKTAQKKFSPLVFIKRFELHDFNFEDYKAFADEFTKSEVQELVNYTKNEIVILEAKLGDIKNYYKSEAQTKFISPLRFKHTSHKA